MKTASQQRGVSWIETCAVMAVLGVLSSQAIPAMGGLIDARRLEGAAVQFATDVHFARTEAVARNQGVRMSLHNAALGSCYVLHTGLSAQCACTSDAPATCTGDAREIKTIFLPALKGVAISSNSASVLFDPLHGTSTPSATFRVSGRSGRTIHQVINVMGRVRSCTPTGGVAGYVTC